MTHTTPHEGNTRWIYRAYVFMAALFLFRVLWTAVSLTDLAADEAYYWDWSRQLDWCYYSKPPMVAWLIGLSTRIGGHTTAIVRMPATILSTLTILIIFFFARRAFSAKSAFFAALAFAVTPAVFLSGWFMTIDAPLVFFWTLALYAVWRALYDSATPFAWWCIAGVATLGGILSKQMMMVFPVLLILFLVCTPEKRRELRRPALYIYLLISACALLPLLYWNAQNDWITFVHTQHHFRGNRHPLQFIVTFLYFIGTQSQMVSPLLWAIACAIGALILWRYRRYSGTVRYLVFFSCVPLACVALMSFRQRILPNWPAVFYIPTSLYVAAWACGEITTYMRVDRFRWVFRPALALGALYVCAVLIFLPASVYVSVRSQSLNDGKLDAWTHITEQVDAFRARMPRPGETFLAGTHRHIVAPLAFYLDDQPDVYSWPMNIVYESQYSVWYATTPPVNTLKGKDMLLVHAAERPLPPELLRPELRARYFEDFTYYGTITNITATRVYSVYRGHTLKEWPRQRPTL